MTQPLSYEIITPGGYVIMIVHYNATESALRNFCMHKHTWRLIDTINGEKASALVYSIVETAKANGLNPFRYLEFLHTEIP